LSLGKSGPNVLFSLLTDCCCLHVLVNFREEQRAYLPHREIEPGRMIAVLVWLHKVSHIGDLTDNEFKKFGFKIGQSFEREIENAVAGRDGQHNVQGSRQTTNKGKSTAGD
jgi:hypothetical protein